MKPRNNPIEALFLNARKGGVQLIFTLLRAEGWTRFEKDPFDELKDNLQTYKDKLTTKNSVELREICIYIFSNYDIYRLIFNLIGNSFGEAYKIRPLPFKVDTTTGLPLSSGVEHITKLLEQVERYKEKDPRFILIFRKAFNKRLLSKVNDPNSTITLDDIRNLIIFVEKLLETYSAKLKSFSDDEKVFPMFNTQFIVFELHTNDTGLCGISFYSPSGATSYFKRYKDRTENLNYMFNNEGTISLSLGDTNVYSHWVYNNRPLYERGYKGRYNIIGEWKPLLYPVSSTIISSEAHKLCKDEKDKRIEGCLFYIYATCHHIIEFIIKSDIELPFDYLAAEASSGKIHFHKVDMQSKDTNVASNLMVYDCTLELNSITVESIKDALNLIDVFVNRLSFRVNGKAEWILKYNVYGNTAGKKTISRKNFPALRNYLTSVKSNDVPKFDTSISWYNNGNNSNNIFTKFLSYYIALEGLAIPLIDGDLEISPKYKIKKVPKNERNEKIRTCIKRMHEQLYDKDPIKFVDRSYFDCIGSIGSKTKNALKKVFGANHPYIDLFFDNSKGISVYNLRHKLAHGDFNHTDQEHATAIENKLHILREITHAFVMNVSLGLKGKRKYNSFNQMSLAISMSDPRSTHVASTLDFIPNKDWKIKWEWLF
jgi:hypothetical protein